MAFASSPGWTRARVPREKRSRKDLGLPSRVPSSPGSGAFSQDVSVEVLWFRGSPQSLVLRDAGRPAGTNSWPGYLHPQARGTQFAPVIRLPQRWDYQGLVQVKSGSRLAGTLGDSDQKML